MRVWSRNRIAPSSPGENPASAAPARCAWREAGHPVALTYHSDEAAGAAVVAEIERSGGRALALHTDVADEAAVEALFAAAEAAFGPVRLLVNSAGVNMRGTPIAEMPLEQFAGVLGADWSDRS